MSRIPLGGPRPDPILDYIRADAAAQGLSLRGYCKAYGIAYASLWDWGIEDYDPDRVGDLSLEALAETGWEDEEDDDGWEAMLYRAGAEMVSGDLGCPCFRAASCDCHKFDEDERCDCRHCRSAVARQTKRPIDCE